MHRWLPSLVLEKQFVRVVRFVWSVHEEWLFRIRLVLRISESVLLLEVEAEECLPIVVLDALDLIKQS